MKNCIVAMAILAAVWIDSVEAAPTANTTSDSSSEKSRQLVINTNVPTAAIGLNNGNPTGTLQTLNVLQQVTKSGNSPLAFEAELAAQQQEALQLQNQNQQQSLLAAVQNQQDQVNTVQAAIKSMTCLFLTKSTELFIFLIVFCIRFDMQIRVI